VAAGGKKVGRTGEVLSPAKGLTVRIQRFMLSLLAAVAVTASTALVGAAPPAGAFTTREGKLLTKINNSRASHGLRPLRLSSDLSTTARHHSRQMASSATLFHTANFATICCWSSIAENVGMDYSIRDLHRALMHSSVHRANILDPRMRVIGVGVVSSGGRLWATELFTRPA
jgi:uncharacterized protein YkwD